MCKKKPENSKFQSKDSVSFIGVERSLLKLGLNIPVFLVNKRKSMNENLFYFPFAKYPHVIVNTLEVIVDDPLKLTTS